MTMQQRELEAWLGTDWTPEQIEQIAADFRDWETENPDASEDESTAMLIAISQHHDGTLDIAELAASDGKAQAAAAEARRSLKAAAIVRYRLGGIKEAPAAREAGMDRMTMRKWLGKR